MLELLQFRHSPYNEKARWALDFKRMPHRRRSLLPGPHVGVKRLTGRTGYLSGPGFSIADLTAASALAMFIKPPNSPMSGPQPVRAVFQALIDRYIEHDGAHWVRDIYARHRAARRDFDGPSEAAT